MLERTIVSNKQGSEFSVRMEFYEAMKSGYRHDFTGRGTCEGRMLSAVNVLSACPRRVELVKQTQAFYLIKLTSIISSYGSVEGSHNTEEKRMVPGVGGKGIWVSVEEPRETPLWHWCVSHNEGWRGAGQNGNGKEKYSRLTAIFKHICIKAWLFKYMWTHLFWNIGCIRTCLSIEHLKVKPPKCSSARVYLNFFYFMLAPIFWSLYL